ncbi:MAG TPA: amino acid adenylation domain-containing protein, partial [Herpetosiphonaceae bacterium]
MTFAELLAQLQKRDIKLWLDDDQLAYNAPKGALTADLRAALVARKAEIIEFLREAKAATATRPQIQRIDRSAELPASFAQQRLWLLDQLTPDSAVYNISGAVQLSGPLDVAALERSLSEIVRRHESLRTTFVQAGAALDGQLLQVIAPPRPIMLAPVDLHPEGTRLPADQRQTEAQRLADEQALRPFDLARGPLLRAALLRLDDREHVLLLTLHHSIADGWSLGVLIRELAALYDALSTGSPNPLPELPIQYADYAAWQRAWVQSSAATSQIAYWKQRLADLPPALELPLDHPRPTIQSYQGASLDITLSRALTEALNGLSQREGVTLYMTLLAAFKLLLFRHTGQDDIVLGTPIAGRTHVEIENLIGCFLNTLLLRTDLSGGPTFRELLRRVQTTTVGAYSHQDVPFEKVLEELSLQREGQHGSPFHVLFNMLNYPYADIALRGLSANILVPPDIGAKFDLTLYVNDQPDGIRLEFVYNADIFERERIAELLAQFVYLLDQIVERPDEQIAQFSLVTPSARTRLPDPQAALRLAWPGLVQSQFARQSRRLPDKPALIDANSVWTYAELEAASNRVASYLIAQGMQPQELIAIYAHRSASLVVALLGILKAGAAFVILDPAYPPARLLAALRIAAPRGWIQLEAAGALPDELAAFVADTCRCRLLLPSSPQGAADSPLAACSPNDPGVTVAPDDLAYVAFTSGSTGAPKAILGTHRPLAHFLAWHCQTFGLDETDRFSMLSGLAHDPLLRDIFTPLWLGATLCIPDPEQIGFPGWLADWMQRESITVTHLTPAMGYLLAESTVPGAIPTLRYAFFGGDMLTRRDVTQLRALAPSVTCVNFYGATETPQAMAYLIVSDTLAADDTEASAEPVPLGRGIDDVQVLVLNAARQLAGIGELGEIYLRTPYLARGYLGDHAQTEARFLCNPFTDAPTDRLYKTGDLGCYRPDGTVLFRGRRDQQVKIRGFRVELEEIAATLDQHPAVRDRVVLVREDEPGSKEIVAYVVLGHERCTPTELHQFLSAKLPQYMVPSAFVLLDALPLTPNGKVDRRALPAPEREGIGLLDLDGLEDADALLEPAHTPTEAALIAIWSDVLKRAGIGTHDNFFELGGHSLLATQIIARVRAAFGVDVPLRRLFEAPTIAALAALIDGDEQTGQTERQMTIRPAQRDADLPLSFAQQRFWLIEQLTPGNAAYHIPSVLRLTGRLDDTALERSLQAIVRRHEALRTTFAGPTDGADEQPTQIVLPALTVPLPVLDLCDLPPNERAAEARRRAVDEIHRPFDLRHGPLVRALVLRLDHDDHLLIVTLHHIVADGWSVSILLRELATLYVAAVTGEPALLPDLPIQYADVAVWQRQSLHERALNAQLRYWREHLGPEGSPAPPTLALPTDRPRPARQTFRGAVASALLPNELVEALQTVSRQRGASLFMTLLAAFKIVLFRWSRETDLVVGTVVANRTHAETEGVVGCFINFLPLRSRLSEATTALELLDQVKSTVLDAYAHQDAPFDRIVEAVNPDRTLSQNPLYNVAFLLQKYAQPPAFGRELSAANVPLDPEIALLDLRLVAQEAPEGIYLSCEYSTDLFDAETIEQLVAAYCATLEQWTRRPATALAQFELPDALAARAEAARRRDRAQTIAVAATFTAEPVAEPLSFWLEKLSIAARIEFAPYSQVFQQLLDPASLLAANRGGVNVVLVRLEDWLKRADEEAATSSRSDPYAGVEQTALDLADALEAAAQRAKVPYLVCICPASSAEQTRALAQIEAQLAARLAAFPGVYLVGSAELLSTYPIAAHYDPHGDELGHVPFTPTFFTALGTTIARKLYVIQRTAYKVIALDCDQTLWGGVCGEDGPRGIVIDAPRRALQEFVLAQRDAGMLICLCSKNNEADVAEVFAQRPDMPLRREHIAAWRVNWQAKSDNLRALADELGLGIDSIILIDDSPVECAEVQANCPEVLTIQLPTDARAIPVFLRHVWAFDHLKITAEDRQRAELYQQNVQRESLRKSSTLDDFLAGLGLEVQIAPITTAQLGRVAQLTQRTNQFNLTTIRRSEAEIQHLCHDPNVSCLTVHVRDRFGDYGLVGVLIAVATAEALDLDTFLLSCRALGRGVEHQMFAHLAQVARRFGRERISVTCIPTARNQPARDFLESIGAAFKRQRSQQWRYEFPVGYAATVAYHPPTDRAAHESRPQQPAADRGAARGTPAPSALLNEIAGELNQAERILAAIEAQKTWLPGLQQVPVAPRTTTEELLVGLWSQLLHVEQVGVHDNFFALGGHSLLATQVMSRIREAYRVDLPLRSLFEAQTIAELAAQIDAARHATTEELAPPIQPTMRDGDVPLSFAQQRLWFLHQLEPDLMGYVVPAAVRLTGALDLAALHRSLNLIVERHEALRTTFGAGVDGQAIQVIAPALTIELPLVDLHPEGTRLPAAEQEAEARRRAALATQRPFDLQHGPLLRATVFRLHPEGTRQEHVLLIVMHHSISDGWSLGVLLRELAALYVASTSGADPALASVGTPLPIQYADFAIWQRAWLQGTVLDRQLDYWKRQLASVPLLDLPTDRPRPAVQTFQGARRSVVLPAPLAEALTRVSQREHVTLYMTLLAAFKIVLARYTGQTDIVVGTPIANRTRTELEGLIGFFVNTLVLRTDLGGNPTLHELLSRVRETTLGAYTHQDVPFEMLVDELQPERDLSRHPLFQAMFVLQNVPLPSLSLPDIRLEPMEFDNGTAQFDLTLELTPTAQGLRATCGYKTDLFDAETIDRLLGHFQTVLTAISADPQQRLVDLPLLTDAEQQQLLVDWNATSAPHAESVWFHDACAAYAERTPDAIAVTYAGERLTYAALDRRANQLAHHLRGLGVRPEAVVAVYMERAPELIVSLLGILKAGGVYLPLDPAYPAQRLAFMLADARPSVLLTQRRLAASVPAVGDQAMRIVCVDDWELLEQTGADSPAMAIRPDQLAYIIYTSGSTGTPKGCLLTHGGLRNFVDAQVKTFALGPDSRVLQFASLSFDASIFEIVMALRAGATLVLAPADALQPGADVLDLLRDQAITAAILPPSLLAALPLPEATHDLPALHTLIAGGEACSAEVVDRWAPGRRFFNAYGPTEATVWSTVARCTPDDGPPPIGRPISNTQVYVLDAALRPVPVGVPGELYIGGVQLGRGYHNRPDLTAERFIPNPFAGQPGARLYRTGDRVRYLPDGSLLYLGRLDHQVKLRGFRIELGEIEAALNRHPAVRESVVVVREDAGRPRLVGYVVEEQRAKNGRPPGTHRSQEPETWKFELETLNSELREFLGAYLPDYMIPSAFVLLDALPLTPNGKIDRNALPAPDYGSDETTIVAPRTPVEDQLAAIWRHVLGVPQVGIHDNFFALGGDSILSLQIVARASQAGLRLTPRQLFQHQTIAELAEVVGAAQIASAEQGPVTGAVPLTPIQRWFFERELHDPQHWNQALVLEARQPLDARAIEQSVRHLLRHHDALRLRFRHTPAGWQQRIAEADAETPFTRIDLAALPLAAQGSAIEAAAARLQTSLSLTDGPLLRVALFDLGPQQASRLLIVVHHLAIDGVSWRILLEDLQRAYIQVSRGETIELPPKTTSFKTWAERLLIYARSDELRQELAYWLEQSRAERLPEDLVGGAHTEAAAQTITVELTAEETSALLRDMPEAYHTQIDEVLLTALAQAFAAWTGASALLVDLEGHGREDIFPGVDLSRTVGWFTTLFPALIEPGAESDPGAALKRVKEQLRQIPQRGLGYGLMRYLSGDAMIAAHLRALPQPEVSFNYLGQIDQGADLAALFVPARESSGPARSPRARRSHLLEINASISGGQLRVAWTYSTESHRRTTIESLAARFTAALRALIDHCCHTAGSYTPSDFPDVRLSQEQLDTVVTGIVQTNGQPGHAPIEAIYPLSPLQQGMLFHALYAPRSGVYVQQMNVPLHGRLDTVAFLRAWQHAVDRHAALRTLFYWHDLSAPIQVVRRHATVPLAQDDWRGLEPDEQAARLEAWLRADRERGFDLTAAPLMRLTLIQLADDRYQLVWSHHHILLDGWSAALMLKDVFAAYQALSREQPLALDHPRPYREYIAWLQQQDLVAAERFWRGALAGFTAPTPLSLDHKAGAASQEQPPAQQHVTLSQAMTDALQTLARQHQLTLNTLIQGAWALLLSRYSGEADVVFGSTLAGRPAELAGVETMVGLFINTLPVRVRVEPHALLVPWLQQLQDRLAALRQHEYSPLAQVQAWSEIQRGLPLFESIVVFENYPVDAALRELSGQITVGQAQAIEQTNYPLTLVVRPGSELRLELHYDGRRFDGATIARMVGHWQTLLAGILAQPTARLRDLPLLPDAERAHLLALGQARAAFPLSACLHQRFAAQAACTPDAIALSYAGDTLTYAQLAARAHQLAHHLQQRGVGPDVPVALCLDRSLDLVVAVLAILSAGGYYVPLDPAAPAERL